MFSFLRSHLTIIYIAKINFYFVFVCYASFYDFSKYIENSKIVKTEKGKKYLARYMGDAPPPSWMLSWSFLKSLSSF